VFAPDLFSSHRPIWSQTSPDIADRIRDLIGARYPALGLIEGAPEQIGAMEVNTSNYRVDIAGSKWVLKRWSSNRDQSEIRANCELLRWLDQRDVPVAVPWPSDSSDPLVIEDTAAWALFPYIEGDYFAGDGGQPGEAGRVIGSLFTVLATAPESLHGGMAPQLLSGADDELLKRVFGERRRWREVLGDDDTRLLERYADRIQMIWSALRAKPPDAGDLQRSHYDLHPHNILFSNGNIVAILDFDACQRQQPGYGLAFCAMKLVRQAMVGRAEDASAEEVFADFRDALLSGYPPAADYIDDFSKLAQAEVLRRILLILRLNFDKSNSSWNHVLRIQLGHLDEIVRIFPSSPDQG